MRTLVASLLLALSASTGAAAENQELGRTSQCFRLGAVLATSSRDVSGGHGSLSTRFSDLRAWGASATGEISNARFGLEVGAAWLRFEGEERYNIHGDPPSIKGSLRGEVALLHASLLRHLRLSARHELLLGPLIGQSFGDNELVGGLTFGAQVLLDLQSRTHSYQYSAGIQAMAARTTGEYEGKTITLLLARFGVAFR